MDQQVYAMKIADIFQTDVRKKIIAGINRKIKSIFPSPDSLYQKDIVKKNEINFPIQIQSVVIANNPVNSGNLYNTKKKLFKKRCPNCSEK